MALGVRTVEVTAVVAQQDRACGRSTGDRSGGSFGPRRGVGLEAVAPEDAAQLVGAHLGQAPKAAADLGVDHGPWLLVQPEVVLRVVGNLVARLATTVTRSGCWRALRPIMKKVARTSRLASTASTAGVWRGSGPSSKVRATTGVSVRMWLSESGVDRAA